MRESLTLCSVLTLQLWTRKRDGGGRWEQYEGDKGMWQIWSITFPNGFIQWISILTALIGSCACDIGNHKLTSSLHSVRSVPVSDSDFP
jgi:hypothetical protein